MRLKKKLNKIGREKKQYGICKRVDKIPMDENRDPEIDPYKYNQLIFDKGVEALQWSKDRLLEQTVWEQPDIYT